MLLTSAGTVGGAFIISSGAAGALILYRMGRVIVHWAVKI